MSAAFMIATHIEIWKICNKRLNRIYSIVGNLFNIINLRYKITIYNKKVQILRLKSIDKRLEMFISSVDITDYSKTAALSVIV